jgi:hypothetical protein
VEVASVTWPASQASLVLSDKLWNSQILRIDDETEGTPGEPIWITDDSNSSEIYLLDRNTLRWGSTGPGSAKTLGVYYLAEAQELDSPTAVPVLIPHSHRWLLVWAAACIAMAVAERETPEQWAMQRKKLREQYHLLASKGRIMRPLAPGIRLYNREVDGVF